MLFGVVDDETHRIALQKDLQRLCHWSEMWQMPFNASKCTVLHLGCHNNVFDYFTDNHKLDAVSEEKDLGILITSNLKSAGQCKQAYAKASKALGIIALTISYKTPHVLLRLYKPLVRPHLEYCVPAWSPHYEKDKLLLEHVQHRFTRMVPGLRHWTCEQRLERLGLWTLAERRNHADLLEVFKMYKGLSLELGIIYLNRFDGRIDSNRFGMVNRKPTGFDSAVVMSSDCFKRALHQAVFTVL